ncbi:MAG: putative zinc-binding peptidase, partial [Myxococcota bacterium]|nr:putative zinc-binding peptidase [Myxococcota bacterium]
MKIFTCSACHQVLFFENVQCTKCGHTLAFLPDHGTVSALEAVDRRDAAVSSPPGLMVALAPTARGQRYRLCRNYVEHAACNWAIPVADENELCRACRLNDVIPNLSDGHAKEGWRRMERAKRRLLHTLIELGLPVESKHETPGGLAFCFLEDGASSKVFTGHNDGIITINLAEADDPFREKTREQLGETYRTLLGHFRHEIGHYYWDRLIKNSNDLAAFRDLFGDEQADYAAALRRHYELGAPPDWASTFVSAYASMHPWEDWAETWSHYLHMVDTLETARTYGLAVRAEPESPDSKA